MKENKTKLNPKFNAFLIIYKEIELVLNSNTIAWKNIYGLHKPTNQVVQIDEEGGVEKDDEEIDDIENIKK